MYQNVTVKIKCFEPNAGKLVAFEELLTDTNKALDYYSQMMPIIGTNRSKLHHATYRHLRKVTNLPAVIIHSTREKAVDAFRAYREKGSKGNPPQFKNNKVIRLCGDSWRLVETDNKYKYFVGVSTCRGRVFVPLCGLYQYKHLKKIFDKEYQTKTAELIKKDKEWYLHVIIRIPIKIPKLTTSMTPVGIDVGVKNLATTVSVDGVNFYSGREATHLREFEVEQQRKIGHKKVKHSLQVIRQRRQKLHYWIKNKNHKISRDIVNKTKNIDNPVIVMEKLTHLRKSIKKRSKKFNRNIHSWAFRQLQEFIEYKANIEGIPVVYVNPKHTSQKCPKCSNIDGKNRNGIYFKCIECGYQAHSDYVASINIQRKFTDTKGFSEQALVNMPLTHTGYSDYIG